MKYQRFAALALSTGILAACVSHPASERNAPMPNGHMSMCDKNMMEQCDMHMKQMSPEMRQQHREMMREHHPMMPEQTAPQPPAR